MSQTPSPAATRAAEKIRQLVVTRLKLHPEAAGGFAREVAAIIDEELPERKKTGPLGP